MQAQVDIPDSQGLTPDNTKSCSNCRKKKIKCQGQLPCCNRCKKWGLKCDLTENIFYSYSTVDGLLKKIDELNAKVKTQNGGDPNHSMGATPHSTLPIPLEKLPVLTSTSEELSNEVGSLTSSSNNEGQGKYIGAATGSNFAKMFLNQMHIQNTDELDHLSNMDFSINDYSNNSFFSHSCATLPPYNITKLAVNNYVNFIHIYCPILNLKELLTSLDGIYRNPTGLTYHEKYVIFMVIAIGLEKGDLDSTLATYYNQFKPIEFYNTAQRYLDKLLSNRTLATLQELLLLVIWQTSINIFKDDNGDLWYLGRYVMALAIELDLHKIPSQNQNLSEFNNELRKRLFWSAFILERSNAVKFGRGLSIRKKDVEIDYPKFMNDDIINDASFYSYSRINIISCLISIELYEIYTLLLETIYISRTKGSKPKLSDEEIFSYKIQIQNLITKTLQRIDNEVNSSLFCYHELKIKTLIASIILNRPSPSFLSPDLKSLLTCKENCMQCLDSFKFLINTNWRSSPSNLHDLVNISLTMVFCCWKTEVDADLLRRFSENILIIMNEVIKFFPSFIKFKNLYMVVSSIIIKGFEKIGMQKSGSAFNATLGSPIGMNATTPGNSATIPQQQTFDAFSDIPSPLQQMKANMMNNINLVNVAQPQIRGKNKRTYAEAVSAPNSSSEIQFQLQHYPMKYSEAQTLQQPQPAQQQIQIQQHSQNSNNNVYIQMNNNGQQIQNTQQQLQSQQMYPSQLEQLQAPPINRHQFQPRRPVQQQQQQQQQQYPVTEQGDSSAMMDTSTQALFQDVFKQYYFQGNETVREDIDQLFEFQRFNWA